MEVSGQLHVLAALPLIHIGQEPLWAQLEISLNNSTEKSFFEKPAVTRLAKKLPSLHESENYYHVYKKPPTEHYS